MPVSLDLTAVVPLATVGAGIGMWVGLGVAVVLMLAFDLFVFGRGRREVTIKESAIWSVVWLAVALGFAVLMWFWQGSQAGSEYLAGYLLERSLSLDNIFVFAVLFSYFAVPLVVQPRVLSWGIALALVLRLIFIIVGAALLSTFHVTFYLFGLLLLYTGYKLFRHDDTDVEPEHNPAFRLIRRYVPMSADYDGPRLFTRENGKRMATPLLAVFVVVATTDVIFAVDSIPAIFAITTDAFIVFAANAFAMLGLRALYFLLVGVMDRFVYLSQGLAVILGIIGVKMLLVDVWHVPIWLSLGLIVVILAGTAILSIKAPPRPPHMPERQRPPATADSDAGAGAG
jgi:tellurite resistance protein TerC